MINFNINIACLALQKFLPIQKIFDTFNITPDEYFLILKENNRTIKKHKNYIDSSYFKNSVKSRNMVEYIYKKKVSSIDEVTMLFKYERFNLIKLLDYITKKHPFIIPIVFRDNKLYNEIKNSRLKFSKQAIENKVFNSKIFKGNKENTEKLLAEAKDTSIEHIAFKWGVSPYIITTELIFNSVGGFWENENIRTNAPFFISDIPNNKFSLEELFYFIDNINSLDVETLVERLNCSKENISSLNSLLEKLLKFYSIKETKIVLASNELLNTVSYNYIFKDFINLKKENNISKSNIMTLFTKDDLDKINKYTTDHFNKILNINNIFNSFEKKKIKIILHFENITENVIGILVGETDKSFSVLVGKNKFREIDKSDVLIAESQIF